ncbi:MAG TPA: SPFH domain-containing protein, partial [Desulfuromonadaceae bacterium]|nr:SPFH domain-containing protein [Desulfuromonadaceae bacterium]
MEISWLIKLVPLFIVGFIITAGVMSSAIKVLREYERGVVFRLGKLLGAKGPGVIFLIPVVDKMVRMDLR